MLLFGGSLTGGGKPIVANDSSAARGSHVKPGAAQDEQRGQPKETLTPHTDVLHRLTNHELRLLEELERTRSKLQAEWRVKLTELQREEPEVAQTLFQRGPPTVDQLTQLFLVPKHTSRPESASQERGNEVKSIMRTRTMSLNSSQRSKRFLPHKKVRVAVEPTAGRASLNREPSLPRLRTNLDVLPILTSAAETAFEVGLEANSIPSPIQSPTQTTQPHILPIFRLPTVNVNATAAALVAKEVETVEEDRDRKQASETLGLSIEEIEMLEAELHGHSTPVPRTRSDVSLGKPVGYIAKLPGLAGPQTKKASAKKQRTQAAARKAHAKSGTNATTGDRGDALRRELESALYSVQHLTRLVKEDIFSAQKICPASELRTSLYFKRWGKEKVENIFRRLLYNFQGVAFTRWKQAVAFEKQQEKLQAYLMYKGSKKLDMFLLNWTHRKLRQAWTKWWSDIVHIKALERAERELDAIRVIQRAVRGYRGRMFARLIRMQKRFALESAAASTIQRQFRGSIVRKFFRLKRLHKRREAAAARIQALGRGFLARQLLRQRHADRRRHKAASRIQALYRGRKTRRDLAARRRQQKVTAAAILIQRRYRGRLGRAKFLRQQIERYRNKAATKIQKIARGMLARRLLVRLREQRKALLVVQNAAATMIQKVYRGHRSRLGTELKLIALREKNKMRRRAAIKIQTAVRCRQARFAVARKKEERLYGMVQLARLWVEYWSEDTSQWFYFNTETGEALWAPPHTGYTKADGMLVLQSGKIIENPAGGELGDPSLAFPNRKKPGDSANPTTENSQKDEAHLHHHADDEDEDDEDRLCVECEEEDALRRCDQCEDVYCDACYLKLHSSAKREKHTWKAIGTMRCIECEKMKATRWCGECQDPYCLGCFTIIHAKGNKVNHQWTDMAAFRKQKKQQEAAQAAAALREEENAQTYDEFMRSADYQYVTELATEEAYTYADPYATDPYSTPSAASYYSGGGGGGATPAYSATGSSASAGGGGEEWTTQYDENSGQYYYYNASTGESRWA